MPSIDEWIMKTGYIYTKDTQKKKMWKNIQKEGDPNPAGRKKGKSYSLSYVDHSW